MQAREDGIVSAAAPLEHLSIGPALLDRCVPASFEDPAAANPNAVAVVDGAGDITYGALVRRANQIACWLRDQCDPEALTVAVLVRHGTPFALATLALLKAGFGVVTLIADAPEALSEDILDDSRCGLLLTDRGNGDRARRLAPVAVTAHFVDLFAKRLRQHPAEWEGWPAFD